MYSKYIIVWCGVVWCGVVWYNTVGILDGEEEERIADLVSPVGHRVVTVYIVWCHHHRAAAVPCCI